MTGIVKPLKAFFFEEMVEFEGDQRIYLEVILMQTTSFFKYM